MVPSHQNFFLIICSRQFDRTLWRLLEAMGATPNFCLSDPTVGSNLFGKNEALVDAAGVTRGGGGLSPLVLWKIDTVKTVTGHDGLYFMLLSHPLLPKFSRSTK